MLHGESVRLKITSACIMELLVAINQAQITLHDIQQLDELNVAVSVHASQYRKLLRIVQKRREEANVISRRGTVWSLFALRKRPVLIIGCLLLTVMMLYLPTRVLFIQVEGNEAVSSIEILDKAEACGVRFWASRRGLRSEEIKNKLLSSIPQLQWAGVNTSGCVAVISVRERKTSTGSSTTDAVRSVVASRDGVVRQMEVLKGTAVCKVGDAVKEGQLLVSGYTDHGIVIGATAAEAEIYADTQHILKAVTPSVYTKRTQLASQSACYSLRFGKKLIKLCKDSGISDATCVKMKKEYDLVLPGGFSLPVSLIIERICAYETTQLDCTEGEVAPWIESAVAEYLESQMIAGKILSGKCLPLCKDGAYYLYGEYACFEMIGKIRNEEIVTKNGQRN